MAKAKRPLEGTKWRIQFLGAVSRPSMIFQSADEMDAWLATNLVCGSIAISCRGPRDREWTWFPTYR
jgi:hypothetical protein